jgi:anti-anti-sigma factor
LLIKISGDTRNNEALLAKKMLSPFLRNKRLTVIVDLKGLVAFEPVVLIGVLNGIKKEVEVSRGNLKLCSVRPEIKFYFEENRLDRIFRVCEH